MGPFPSKVRNAQNLASTYNLYAEAYYAVSNAYPSTANVAAAITAMANGQTVVNSRLNTTNQFRLPGLTAANVATNKLTVTNNQLVFDPDA